MTSPFAPTSAATELFAPAQGRLVKLEEVPDEMFAEKMLGDGFAVDPNNGTFVAPIAGELVVLANTLHAYAIRSAEGVEVLVHIGVDTVELKGQGFSSTREVGERVNVGDAIIYCDLDRVADAVPSMLTPVIVTNGDAFTITDVDLASKPGHPVARVTRA